MLKTAHWRLSFFVKLSKQHIYIYDVKVLGELSLIKLTISNFKGIKRGEIDLPQVSIPIGPNNSGKTTILETLSLFPNPLRRAPYVIPTVHGEKVATSLEVLL